MPRPVIARPAASWPARPRLASLLLIAALAACTASPTLYQAERDGAGYSEQRIEADRYRVKFAGNDATSRETVEDYALYRAAELTLQTGHDYFKVASKDVEPVIESVRGVSPSVGIGLGGGNVGFGISTGIGGGRADYAYVAYLDIVMFDGAKPEGERDAYEAYDVVESLKSKIGPNVLIPTRPAPEDQGQP